MFGVQRIQQYYKRNDHYYVMRILNKILFVLMVIFLCFFFHFLPLLYDICDDTQNKSMQMCHRNVHSVMFD